MRAHTPTHCKEDREEDWREKIESEDQNRKSNIQQHNSWRKMKQGIGEEEVLKGSSQNWLHCQTESAHHTHNGQKQTHTNVILLGNFRGDKNSLQATKKKNQVLNKGSWKHIFKYARYLKNYFLQTFYSESYWRTGLTKMREHTKKEKDIDCMKKRIQQKR